MTRLLSIVAVVLLAFFALLALDQALRGNVGGAFANAVVALAIYLVMAWKAKTPPPP